MAFREFLQKRCEEVTCHDAKRNGIDVKILALERKLLPMLNDEAKTVYLEIEELTTMLQNYTDNLLIY